MKQGPFQKLLNLVWSAYTWLSQEFFSFLLVVSFCSHFPSIVNYIIIILVINIVC